jgi:hypothetical protein
MGIIDKLKKGKKNKSVLDSLIKKKEPQKTENEAAGKTSDIEVRELNPVAQDKIATPEDIGMEPIEDDKAKSVREFRTEGMHEFTLDSLGNSSTASVKAEYKTKINRLMNEDKIDEAIAMLQELKQKLAGQK